MRARTYRRSILLWAILMLSACRWGMAQTSARFHTFRVEPSRVWVPVNVGDCPIRPVPTKGPPPRPMSGPDHVCCCPSKPLTAKGFRLFVDGKKQKVQSVTVVFPTDNGVRRDNLGAHSESSDIPQGVWSTSDEEPKWLAGITADDYYVISFSPPRSPKGSCHRIKIKDSWDQPFLYYRHEYCNVPHASSDPLRGTPEGARLKRDIASVKKGRVHISAEASYVYTASGKARVQIDTEFPYTEIQSRYYSLTIAYKKDGEEVARRSAYYCDDYCIFPFNPMALDAERYVAFAFLSAPIRYAMQMELPPGDYRIAVAIGLGPTFGVTEVPLSVRKYDAKQLSISSIALCKRVRKVGDPPIAVGFVPLVSKGYEFTPAADTMFRKGEPLIAYFQVYEPALGGSKRSPVSVQFAMRMIDEKSGAVLLKKVLSAASYRVPGQRMIPIAVEPELDKLHLKPGPYKLEIQAFDSVGQKTPWQAAAFSYQ